MSKLESLAMSSPGLPTSELFGILGECVSMLGRISEDFERIIDFDDRKGVADNVDVALNLAKSLHSTLSWADEVTAPWSGMPR